jgi:hypothetical protein
VGETEFLKPRRPRDQIPLGDGELKDTALYSESLEEEAGNLAARSRDYAGDRGAGSLKPVCSRIFERKVGLEENGAPLCIVILKDPCVPRSM